MTSFSKFQVRYDEQCCTVILFIEPGNANEEFASELGTKNDLRQEASRFIKAKLQFISVKTVKVMVGTALVASFTFGSVSPIFAATNTVTLSEVQNEAQVLEQVSNANTATPDSPTGQSGTETTPVGTTEPSPTPAETTPTDTAVTPDPGLVPGEFFYFVKILSEKIELALTFDDVGKAQLLAEFAGKRVAEAQALLAAGDTTGATSLLNQALENQELALNYTENSGIPSLDGTTTVPVTVNPDETTSQDSTVTTPNDTVPLTEEQTALLEVRDQLQTQFALNIIALMTALQKVDNAEAKAELTENIQESFIKLEKQLGKLDRLRNETDQKEIGSKIADLRENIQEDAEDIQEEIQDVVAAPNNDDEEDDHTSGVTPSPAVANKKQNLEKRAEEKREAANRENVRDEEKVDIDEDEDDDNNDVNARKDNSTEAVNRKADTRTVNETRGTYGDNQNEKQKNTLENKKEERKNNKQEWDKNKENEDED